MSRFDMLVLGAGIVGSACAFEFARAGLRVGIIERGVPGGAATAAGMGHLVVMDDSPAQLALTRYSRQLWQELVPELPPSVEYEAPGTIWVAADDEELAEVAAKHATLHASGVRSVVLDADDLALTEPSLRRGLAGGLLVPEDAVVYPPAAAAFFLQSALRHNAVLLREHAATRIGSHEVQLADGTTHTADHIILATGTDTTLLPSLPIQKRKGHLVITERCPGLLRHQLVELGYLKSAHRIASDSVAFNVQPRRTGQLLIGSSRQYGNEVRAADPAMLRQMLERAYSYMPALAQLNAIRVWTGFRAATPDKLPLIGPAEDPSVLLAMGFEGLGITNATGAARLLLDHVLRRPSAIDTSAYLPSRLSREVLAHA